MATREQVYEAIRNADRAGDSAAVRKLGEYLKTLPESGPAIPEVSAEDSLARIASLEQEIADREGFGAKAKEFGRTALDFGKGVADTALSLGSQAILAPVAGAAGLITAPFGGSDKAAEVVRKVQGLAYEPRSEVGQQAAENIATPFRWVADKADTAGQAVSDVTGSPALGAVVNTAIQGAPAFLSRGARQPFVSAGQAVKGAFKKTATPASSAAAGAAQAYARNAGIDWDALPQQIKAQLTEITAKAGNLDGVDPTALARYARLQSLEPPVPATRGQITRDPVMLRNEGNVSTTPQGAPIRDTHLAANTALLENIERLKTQVSGRGKTAAVATTAEEAGGAVQGALRGKEAASIKNYQGLYNKARETEPNATVSVEPIKGLLSSSPEIQNLGWVNSWIKKAESLTKDAEGKPVPMERARLGELMDLRSQATAIARTGGKEGYYAGEVVKAIDSAMEAVPEAAAAWRAANEAFKRHKTEFAEQGSVGKLVDNASRTDRATALEKTVDSITNGSIEGIRQVKRSLLTGPTEAARTAGRQAMREIRAEVIRRIRDTATRSVAENVDGSPNITAAGLKRALDAYGPQKLDEIFGPGTSKELQKILQATKDVKTLPPSAAVGSSTFANVLAFLGNAIDKIPVVGGPIVDLAKGVAKVREIGAADRVAKSANTTPLGDLVKDAAKAGRRNAAGKAVKETTIAGVASGEAQK